MSSGVIETSRKAVVVASFVSHTAMQSMDDGTSGVGLEVLSEFRRERAASSSHILMASRFMQFKAYLRGLAVAEA